MEKNLIALLSLEEKEVVIDFQPDRSFPNGVDFCSYVEHQYYIDRSAAFQGDPSARDRMRKVGTIGGRPVCFISE